jgi:AcrR family transcriptional regulator
MFASFIKWNTRVPFWSSVDLLPRVAPMPSAPSPKVTRTRRDIVQAAIECWSTDNTASLGDVAELARVGRTTVNRYFSSRSELVAAVDEECRTRFSAAVVRARPADDAGLPALQRVCAEFIQLGEVLGLVFADNALVDPDTWDEEGDVDAVAEIVSRGQADGSIAADLPLDWLTTLIWTSLFAAWLRIQSGSGTRHEVSLLLNRTLAAGIAGK